MAPPMRTHWNNYNWPVHSEYIGDRFTYDRPAQLPKPLPPQQVPASFPTQLPPALAASPFSRNHSNSSTLDQYQQQPGLQDAQYISYSSQYRQRPTESLITPAYESSRLSNASSSYYAGRISDAENVPNNGYTSTQGEYAAYGEQNTGQYRAKPRISASNGVENMSNGHRAPALEHLNNSMMASRPEVPQFQTPRYTHGLPAVPANDYQTPPQHPSYQQAVTQTSPHARTPFGSSDLYNNAYYSRQ